MRTISIINQKGGCGKTTTAINLSAVLARTGKRVLLIDMDPQSHCAAGLGIPEQRIEMDIGDAMLAVGAKAIDPTRLLWRAVRNLDLAPSRMRLASLEASKGGLAHLADKHRRLHAVLERFRSDYDVAIIDCSPAIGLLTYNALAAADMAIIPVETGFFSLQGANRQLNTVKSVSKKLGVSIASFMLPTLHDQTNTVACDLLDEMHRRYNDRIVPVVIRRDTRLREAVSFGQTIVDYAPGSSGAEDYGRLGIWVMEHLTARKPLPAEAAFEQDGSEEFDITSVANLPSEAAQVAEAKPMQAQQPQTSAAFAPAPSAAANTTSPAMPASQASTPEAKPLTRAEDVARRAQEFLRRIASGRAPANGTSNGTASVPTPSASSVIDQAASNLPASHPSVQADEDSIRRFAAGTRPTTQQPATPPAPASTSPLPNAARQNVALPSTTITMPGGIAAPGAVPTSPPKAASVAPVPSVPVSTSRPEPKPIDASQGPVLLEARNVLEMINEPPTSVPVANAAERLLGVHETSQGLLFVQPMSTTRQIAIAGAFNNWSTTEHVMRPNMELGVYELCIRLPKGKFPYRLVVDGHWTHDTHNPITEPNPFGELNSIAHVHATAASPTLQTTIV